MRRLLTLLLSVVTLAAVLVGLPTLTTAGAAPRPVTAALQQLPLTGVDGPAGAGLRRAGVPGPLLLSAPLSTRRFALLGVTWAFDPLVSGTEVRVRHRSVAGAWSGWEELEADGDDAPDAGSIDTRGVLRGGTAPMWTGPAGGVQVRVDRVSGAAPRDVRIELVDPGTSPADAMPAAPRASAHAGEPQPELITRAQWGADESIRRGRPTYNATVKVGFVHHTASSNDYSPEQAAAMIRGIYAYHVKSNGWSDIGYNYLVDRYGRAYEGRAGGLDRFVVGAHTGGFNTDSFGVSLLGDFSTVAPDTATVGTLTKVLAWKLGAAFRDPLGDATLTSAGGGTSRYAAGTSHAFDVVSGHRDAGNTTCPGATTYAMLPQIRDEVVSALGAAFADPVAQGAARQNLGARGPVGVRARTLGGPAWTGTVSTVSGDVLRTVSGEGGEALLEWDLTDAAGAPVKPGSYVLRLTGVAGEDPALAYARTVVVDRPNCRGTPLQRAVCGARQHAAGG